MSGYPKPGLSGVRHLFLAFTGYSIGSDRSEHYQHWEQNDFIPVLNHINRRTGSADASLFTEFLFLGLAVKTFSGAIRYIDRNDEAPGTEKDWQNYKNELFAPGRNLNALYAASRNNRLGHQLNPDVWIALPYPHPTVFPTDFKRAAAVRNWIDSFLFTWSTGCFARRLILRGFYWLQESEYYRGPQFHDAAVMRKVNRYIHRQRPDGQSLKALWIPYQKAAGWDRWKRFGFDLSILQPSYYFDQTKSLEAGAADAYSRQQGVEIEFDLAVHNSDQYRSRFLEYLEKGTAGGYDATGRYYGPYMQDSPIGWYAGGWYWENGVRQHALHKLFFSGDVLYDKIWEFVKGTY